MSEVRPRIGVEWAEGARAGPVLLAAARELATAPGLDLVLCGPSAPLQAAARRAELGALELAHDPLRLDEALAAARERETCLLIPSALGSPAAGLRGGWLDGRLEVAPPARAVPRLRLRSGMRVIEPWPDAGLAELAARCRGDALRDALRAAVRCLRALGVARPRLAVFELPGIAELDAALARARPAGAQLLGPLAAGEAATRSADALVALTSAQAELPLAYAGSGPETGLALGEPVAWPGRAARADLILAAQRLGRVLAAGGELAAAREAARRPAVSIASRTRPEEEERCPYCRFLLHEAPDASAGHPGPAVHCAGCGTRHHRGCVAEHGRCTVLGCTSGSGLRLGVEIPYARLGAPDPVEFPFEALEGDPRLGVAALRVEAPIDDPEARPSAVRLRLELGRPRVARGEFLEGHVVVSTSRPIRARGGTLRLCATLTTRDRRRPQAPQAQTILDRRATFVGAAPASAFGRLQDGVVSLFGARTGVEIPAGVRRYPFSFRLHRDHPATVTNRRGDQEESVATRLEAVLDTDAVETAVEVV